MPPKPAKGSTFQPANTDTTNKNTQTAAVQIEAYVQAVIVQPKFPVLPGVKDLQAHQTLSQDNAQQWIDTVRTTLYQSNTNLMSFANKFTSFYEPLYKLAQHIDTGDNRKKFIAGLQLLHNSIKTYENDAKHCVQVLGDWSKLLVTDSQNFASDLSQVEALYEGDKGKLANLQKAIRACATAVDTDVTEIAGGAAITVVGALTVTIGLLAEIPTAGATTAVVCVGLGVIAGGATLIGIATKDEQTQIDEQARLTKELAETSAEVATTHTAEQNLASLSASCKKAVAAANLLLKAWQTLGTNFKACIDSFNSVSPNDGDFITSELDSANKDWSAVVGVATIIQDQLIGIPVKSDLTKPPQVDETKNSAVAAAHTVHSNRKRKQALMDFALQNRMLSDDYGSIVQSLCNSIHFLQRDSAAINAMVDVGDGLKQRAQRQAQEIQDTVIPKLVNLGTIEADKLQDLIHFQPVIVPLIKAHFALISSELHKLVGYTSAATKGAEKLVSIAMSAVQTSSESVEIIAQRSSGENDDIKKLTEQIIRVQKQIDIEQASVTAACIVFPLLCPAATQLAELITHKDDLLKLERIEMAQLSGIGEELQAAEAKLAVYKAYRTAATNVNNHTNQLVITLQVLASHFSAVVNAASEKLMTAFIQAQGSTLVGALRQLAGLSLMHHHLHSHTHPRHHVLRANDHKNLLSNPSKVNTKAEVPSLPTTLDCISAITAANSDISSSANILVLQPNITLNDVTQFAEQFQLARDHAQQFNVQYISNITMVLASFRSLSTLVSAILAKIDQRVAQKDFKAAVQGIQIIQAHIGNTQTTIHAQQAELSQFLSVVRDDQSRFIVLASTVPAGLNDSIKQLSEKINDLQSQIAADNTKIARGATDTIIKVVLLEIAAAVSVGVGTITFPVAAGAGELTVLATKALNASIEAGSGAAKEAALGELKSTLGGDNFLDEARKRVDTLQAETTTLAKDQRSLAVFQTVNVQVQQIVTAAQAGVNALGDIYDAAGREEQPFQLIMEDYKKHTVADLTEVKKRWANIGNAASKCMDCLVGINV